MNRTSVAELLTEARGGLSRLSPTAAEAAVRAGGLLIDIRPEAERAREGDIPGARLIERNVFEWRCDPDCNSADSEIIRDQDRVLIVVCSEGYQSSLAAATLQRFGYSKATDLIGGFRAWRDAGLAVAKAQGG
jgi:rhodanese-related sulfurtransferase